MCSLDGTAFAPCPGSRTYSGLADGPHTFRVLANDGLQGGPAVARSWTVDTAAPDTVLSSTPAAVHRDAASVFTFRSDDPGATFECWLGGDGGHDWQPCTSPRTYTALPEGTHPFKVRAVDARSTSTIRRRPSPSSSIAPRRAPGSSAGRRPVRP
jgi:hypothetical protein